MFGLTTEDIDELTRVLKTYPEVEEAIMFGSRAKGNYKTGSDVDIALKGRGVNYHIATTISGILNEDTLMPYRFDVISYNDISNADLTQHINRVGIVFYKLP